MLLTLSKRQGISLREEGRGDCEASFFGKDPQSEHTIGSEKLSLIATRAFRSIATAS